MRPVLGDAAPPLCWEKRTLSRQEDHVPPLQATVKSTLKPGKPCKGLKDSQGTQPRSL